MNKEHIGDGAYVEMTSDGIRLSAPRNGTDDEVFIDYLSWQNLRNWMLRHNVEWK